MTDRNTGESYSFDVTDVDVTILKVYDEEGEQVEITTLEKIQIEKILENNLNFEIYRKY